MAVQLDRACFTAAGPEALAYVQSMVSNDVETIAPGEGVYALLLTPKARVIADLEIYRVGEAELVLAAPADRQDEALAVMRRSRFRRKLDLEPSGHAVLWHGGGEALARLTAPEGDHGLVAAGSDAGEPDAYWELARIEAGVPRWGHEFGAETMPAEAGLVERAVSFTKGCYPGQEPVARLNYRGHANRGLRGLALEDGAPQPGAELTAGDRAVGRITSVADSPRLGAIALGIVRREVEDGAVLAVAGGGAARVVPLPFVPAIA